MVSILKTKKKEKGVMSKPIQDQSSSSSSSYFQPQQVESQQSGRWSLGAIASGTYNLASQVGSYVINAASYSLGYGAGEGVHESGIRNPKVRDNVEAVMLYDQIAYMAKNDPEIMAELDKLMDMEPGNVSQVKMQEIQNRLEPLIAKHEARLAEEKEENHAAPRGPAMVLTPVYDSDSE